MGATPLVSWRIPLESALSPQDVIPWLSSDHRPFALVGQWLGLTLDAEAPVTLLGSEPVTVASPDDDPFALMSRQPAVHDGPAKVGGGWVGWLGYELGARIESLPPQPPAPVPGPAFSLAFHDHFLIHDEAGWWFEALVTEEREQLLRERLELWRGRLSQSGVTDDRDLAVSGAGRAILTSFEAVGSGGPGHLVAVADCRERIAAGDLFQANLCMRLEARIDGDLATLFGDAVQRARPRFGALLDGVLSLSPERFLRRQGRTVTAEPIKGTRSSGDDAGANAQARQELEASTKDAAEHVMIVDLMRNDLGRVSTYGSVSADLPRAEAHANVWHLVSTVQGLLRDEVNDGELLRATFPPGSVTGAPKVQAMKVISELEVTARGLYTGAIGIASPLAGLDLSVAIRTFESDGERIWLGVGGGVVADSEPELELAEALTKAIGPIAAIGGQLQTSPESLLKSSRARLKTLMGSPRFTACEQALHYGQRPDPSDGLFDTLLVEHDLPVLADEHILRLATSMHEVYGLSLDAVALRSLVDGAARKCAGVRSRLRIDADPDGRVSVITRAAGQPPTVAAQLVPFILPGGIGVHKWRDRALMEALTEHTAGRVPLLVDLDGTVLEAAQANVWIREGETLLTPPTDGRILSGITRAQLLAQDAHAREQSFDLHRLAAADEVFLTGSVAGKRPAVLDRDQEGSAAHGGRRQA